MFKAIKQSWAESKRPDIPCSTKRCHGGILGAKRSGHSRRNTNRESEETNPTPVYHKQKPSFCFSPKTFQMWAESDPVSVPFKANQSVNQQEMDSNHLLPSFWGGIGATLTHISLTETKRWGRKEQTRQDWTWNENQISHCVTKNPLGLGPVPLWNHTGRRSAPPTFRILQPDDHSLLLLVSAASYIISEAIPGSNTVLVSQVGLEERGESCVTLAMKDLTSFIFKRWHQTPKSRRKK